MSRRRLLSLLFAACLALAPAIASAEIVRGGGNPAGPLDLSRAKVGQHTLQLLAEIETSRPLPRLQLLGSHPTLKESTAERYLCLNVASPAIGRRLLCPSGRIRKGRIDVGVSVVTRRGTRREGFVTASVNRGRRSLKLEFGLRSLGLKPGRLSFSVQSSWYGPDCQAPSADRAGGRATCRDRLPGQGSGTTRVFPVRRVGCRGFSDTKVFNGPRSRREVALTFDDGPSVYTPQILSILERYDTRATFFDIGQQVPPYAAYANRVLAQGSDLGNHSTQHDVGPGKADIANTNRVIEKSTGFRPCLFRPPTGVLPASTQSAVESLRMVSVVWDVDTSDYSQPGANAIVSRATNVRPGSIVLMHDGGGPRNQTVDALPQIIEKLKSRGYRLVTVTEMLGGRYELDEVHRTPRAFRPITLEALLTPPPAYAGP